MRRSVSRPVLYTDVDSQCDKLVTDDHHQFTTLTKLTASGTISHFREMVGAHQNLNGQRDLTTPLSGWFAIRWLALPTVNIPNKFEVSISTYCKDMKGDTKCQKWGGLHLNSQEPDHTSIIMFLCTSRVDAAMPSAVSPLSDKSNAASG